MVLPTSTDTTTASVFPSLLPSPTGNEPGNRSVGGESVDSARNTVELYFVFCLLGVLAVAGTCGNVVVLNVFSRPSKRDRACPGASATVYVLALAVADLITCLVVIPSTIYIEHVQYHIDSDFVCKFYQVCAHRTHYYILRACIVGPTLAQRCGVVDRVACFEFNYVL